MHPSKLELALQVGVGEHFNLVSYIILPGEFESRVKSFKKGAKFRSQCDISVISLWYHCDFIPENRYSTLNLPYIITQTFLKPSVAKLKSTFKCLKMPSLSK